jgi:nitrous oxidase accessory protein
MTHTLRFLRSFTLGLVWATMLGAALGLPGAAMAVHAPEQQAAQWVVSPSGPFTTIQKALEAASPGDTIVVRGGVYQQPLVVEKSITLIGEDWPVIDGGGLGSVVTLNAAGIVFRGFEVRGSGSEPDRDHSGIALKAADILVENNRLYDVLFGVFVARADRAIVRNNQVTSKAEYDIARKGDAIRIWYSQDVLIENNFVREARDVVAWYANGIRMVDNHIENGRYGIHLMYCNEIEISRNRLLDNSVGIYTMYSDDVVIAENDIRRQRGPSGYALGFKDANNVLVHGNLLVDNRVGAFLDGTPYRPNGFANFENNIFAYNDIGVLLMSFVKGSEYTSNTFWENVQQTGLQGSGKAGINHWQGNYWSDYAGFDADGDGFGDLPYRSERFFESLTGQEPRLRAFIFSPSAQALEFAAVTFPIIKPQPKLEDPRPAMRPAEIPARALPETDRQQAVNLSMLGVVLAGGGVWLASAGWKGNHWMDRTVQTKSEKKEKKTHQGVDQSPSSKSMLPIVQVQRCFKSYGKAPVLNGIDLRVMPGESVALWGENGAGKTTLLKALLHLIDFQGDIRIAGLDVRRSGKQARALAGYVPQETVFYDMSVLAAMHFFARLKKAPLSSIPLLLEKLGLTAHQQKPVPALSGGLKQRLALGVALLSDPPLLLLDEPTANLDAAARRDYLALLQMLRLEGKTIVFASHRSDEVAALADRVILLEHGKIAEEILPDQLPLRLSPEFCLTLWVAEEQRQQAYDILAAAGWKPHLNGHGTVVLQIPAQDKLRPMENLIQQGVQIADFQLDGETSPWN